MFNASYKLDLLLNELKGKPKTERSIYIKHVLLDVAFTGFAILLIIALSK